MNDEDITYGKEMMAPSQVPRRDGGLGPAESKSLVSRLCEQCIKLTKDTLKGMRNRRGLPSIAYRSLEKSGCSLILWADGHKIVTGNVDEACRKS